MADSVVGLARLRLDGSRSSLEGSDPVKLNPPRYDWGGVVRRVPPSLAGSFSCKGGAAPEFQSFVMSNCLPGIARLTPGTSASAAA